jgi:hypothetical protein
MSAQTQMEETGEVRQSVKKGEQACYE